MGAIALIIEDDAGLAELFAEALRAAQFETEIAGDGQRAIRRLSEIIPTVVLLDLHLPWVHGESILEVVHADPRLSKTIVIIVSADHHSIQRLEGKADFALVKPITFSQLRDLAAPLHPDHKPQ